MTTEISVIVPLHLPTPAHLSLFRESMASLEAQTFGDFEVVCVLNGSCMPLEDLKGSLNLDMEVRWVDMGGKASGAAARNLGVRESRGRLIAQIDADDLYHPRKMEKQVAAFDEYGCDFLGTLYYYLKPDGTHVNSHYDERYCDPSEVAKVIRRRNVMCHGSVMFSRDAFEYVGGYDEANRPRSVWPRYGHFMCEDWDLWIRAVEEGVKVGNLPDRLYYYRIGTSVPA